MYFGQPTEPKVLQLFRGIFTGLEVSEAQVEACVDEAATTVEKFEQSFQAFKQKNVIPYLGANIFYTN